MKRVNSSSADGSSSSSKPKRIYKLRNNSKETSIDTNDEPINNKITRSVAATAAAATADREQTTKNVLDDELNNSDIKKTKATNLLNALNNHNNQNRSSKRLITRRSLLAAASATANSTNPTDPRRRRRSTQTNNANKKKSSSKTISATSTSVTAKEARATKSKTPSADTAQVPLPTTPVTRHDRSRNVDNNNKLEVMGNINNNNNDNNTKIETKAVFKALPHSNLVVNGGTADQIETLNDNDDDLDDNVDDDDDDGTTTKLNVAKKRTRTKRKYICHFCNKQFFGGNDLRKHIRIHTDERPFECQHCGQKFRQGGCLKNHIASQHGTSEVFICFYCNKSFPIKERLRLHMRLHSGEKPYQCSICFKRFARGGQLKQHLASHSGIKKYHCTQCSASFSCSVNLKLHLKSHSNVRDFTCHLCSKSFIRPDALKKHLSCYHENVKAFYCNICSKTFKGHLPQHMRTHENLKTHGCAICLSRFSQKSQLIVHQRIHSGERPYRCQVCWQAFAHSSVLKLHIRKHTGEKPFKCVLCKDTETAFSQLPHLKTHMRAIHGMDKAYNCDSCTEYFKTKQELQEHKFTCPKAPRPPPGQEPNENFPIHVVIEPKCSSKESTLSRMRLLIAVLLKKISSQDKLKQLGFDKRLIDNVLVDALKMAGQNVCTDTKLHEVERLKKNVDIFLEFTIPESYMKKIRTEKRSTEELLEDLTSNFNREPTKKA